LVISSENVIAISAASHIRLVSDRQWHQHSLLAACQNTTKLRKSANHHSL
jgi:hypothetical protein